MLPTPTTAKHPLVYEPAEDTFLFLDALESDQSLLKEFSFPTVLEIGSGSGCVSSFLAKMLGPDAIYTCCDINPHALECTRKTADLNQVELQVIRADLVDCFHSKFDIILFNPPYVVTEMEEVGSMSIEAAWAGGPRGRVVTDRLLPALPRILKEKGVFYLVAVKENDPEEIQKWMASEYGWASTIVQRRKAGNEGLCIIRFKQSS